VLLHARNFNRIAASTIRVGPGYDVAAEDVHSTLGDELAGRTGGQQQLVQAKLLRHIGEIRAAFATGVQAGLTAILSPAMRDTAEGFAAEVTRMYRARRLYLLGHGLTVQEAWADAANAQQAPALAGVGRHGAAGFH
jgi:hypothetical protein